MSRRAALAGALLVGLFAHTSAADAPQDMLSTMSVPDGFTVEVVAAPPLVEHPMMASFDPQGRLYVADSAGFNLSAEELLEKTPNRIVRLEDTDGDGRFDRRTMFADKMTFPMGAQWYRGAIYVASPPSIWRLEDRDGDGVAEKRQELVSKFGFIGNAADIHGCFLGPDGRIYWCDGRHGHHFESADGKVTSKGQAARIFSCRPDGTDVDILCGGGMDNPVELAFAPEGDVFGTMTFYNPDDHRHDAIVHYIHGGVYPRKHSVVGEFKRTGDFMPPLCLFETVAPAGLMRYQGSHFPESMQGNLFSVQFNTHKVLRHPLARDGATWRATTEEFLASSHIDFHPTDVLEDADGSLLVIDTGGWFRHGCPTSQVAKPDVLGAIYRIRRADGPRPDDPRGLLLVWDGATVAELVPRLADPRPAVVERAIDSLAQRGDFAVDELAAILDSGDRDHVCRNAIWALTRIDTPTARTALRKGLQASSRSVRLTAARAAGTLRDAEALADLIGWLDSDEPALRREAATAVGRLGDSSAVPALFESIAKGGDRFVEHAILYALIEIADRSATLPGLGDSRPEVRRAALIALDQMDGGDLSRDMVVRLLDGGDFALQQAALEVIGRHSGWADETVNLLSTWLADEARAPERTEALRGALVAFAGNAAVQELVGQQLADAKCPAANRLLLLECMARSYVEPWPASWTPGVRLSLADPSSAIASAAVQVVEARCNGDFLAEIAAVARDEDRPRDLRIAALGLVGRAGPLAEADLEFLSTCMQADSILQRLAAARAIGQSRCDGKSLLRVARLAAAAGPLELPALLEAFKNPHAAPAAELGLVLVESLRQSPGRSAIPAAQIVEILAAYDAPRVRQFATEVVAEEAAKKAGEAARLAALEPHLVAGDAQRGRVLFTGRKAGCVACHRANGAGDTVGPDLSKIGQIRAPRDLLESIVLPSITLARGYETVTVSTAAGLTHSGVIARETSEAIYLRTAQREEVRISRDDVEELAPNPVSIMPQGLDQTLSAEEIADLVAYLQTLK